MRAMVLRAPGDLVLDEVSPPGPTAGQVRRPRDPQRHLRHRLQDLQRRDSRRLPAHHGSRDGRRVVDAATIRRRGRRPRHHRSSSSTAAPASTAASGRRTSARTGSCSAGTRNGGFAEFVSAAAEPDVPACRSPSTAARRRSIQVLTTCLHAQRQIDIFPGEYVVVMGLGVTGQLHVQLAKARGAHGHRHHPQRRQARAGGDARRRRRRSPAATAAVEQRADATEGRGADVVIETTGVRAVVAAGHQHGPLGRPAAPVRHHHREGRSAALLRPVLQGAVPHRGAGGQDARIIRARCRSSSAAWCSSSRCISDVMPLVELQAAIGMLGSDSGRRMKIILRALMRDYLITQTLNGLFSAALLFLIASGLDARLRRDAHRQHRAWLLLHARRLRRLHGDPATQSLLLGAVAAMVDRRRRSASPMQRLFLRRFAGQPLAQMMMTMGFALLFRDVALMIWGGDPFTLPYPGWLRGSMEAGEVVFPLYRLFVIVVAAVVGVALWARQRADADRRAAARRGRRP